MKVYRMETQFFAFVAGLVSDGEISVEKLVVVNLLFMVSITYYFVRPIFNKNKLLPNKEEIKNLISSVENKPSLDAIDRLTLKVDKLSETIDSLEIHDISYSKDMEMIKRDIEMVKQMLNQFQGHMLYGQRQSDFGNKELR